MSQLKISVFVENICYSWQSVIHDSLSKSWQSQLFLTVQSQFSASLLSDLLVQTYLFAGFQKLVAFSHTPPMHQMIMLNHQFSQLLSSALQDGNAVPLMTGNWIDYYPRVHTYRNKNHSCIAIPCRHSFMRISPLKQRKIYSFQKSTRAQERAFPVFF